MPESATQRIAAKLAAKRAEAAAAPEPSEAEEDELLPGEPALAGDDDELEASPDEPEAKTKKTSVAERAAAARAARAASKAPTPITEAPSAKAKAAAPKHTVAKAVVSAPKSASTSSTGSSAQSSKSKSTATKSASSGSSAKSSPGKKQPSPAQLAAREAFAARSRARAAEAHGEAEPAKPVQTEADVKASQSAKRKAAAAEAAAAVAPKRVSTGKSVVVQKANKKAVVAKPEKAPLTKGNSFDNKKLKAPSARADSPKEAILALWAKGLTRQQIVERTGNSYASVFYHTKGTPGTGNSGQGRIFVETNLDENGQKRKGKPETVSRSEAMRRMYLSGMSVGDIARSFDPPLRYQIAYTAVRSLLGSDEDE